MAITAYTGVPGSGKSYALVSEVILPALGAGRRVVTNVDGLRVDAIRTYVTEKHGQCGDLVTFDGADTLKVEFWPQEGEEQGQSRLRPGDLLVMDEVRLYWPPRGKFPPHIMAFLRFHRHWVAADGTATDIVLASQLVTDFSLDFRGLIERNLKFKKLSTIGAPSHFVWNAWEGSAQRKNEVVARGTGKYRPEIFELYSSYKGGAQGQERQTDRRAVIWNNKKLWAVAAGVVAMVAWSGFWLMSFFNPDEPAQAAAVPGEGGAPEAAESGNPYGAQGPASPARPRAVAPEVISTTWRIAGYIDLPGRRAVILADNKGVVRLENPSLFLFVDGMPASGLVDGERVLASSVNVSENEGKPGVFGALLPQ